MSDYSFIKQLDNYFSGVINYRTGLCASVDTTWTDGDFNLTNNDKYKNKSLIGKKIDKSKSTNKAKFYNFNYDENGKISEGEELEAHKFVGVKFPEVKGERGKAKLCVKDQVEAIAKIQKTAKLAAKPFSMSNSTNLKNLTLNTDNLTLTLNQTTSLPIMPLITPTQTSPNATLSSMSTVAGVTGIIGLAGVAGLFFYDKHKKAQRAAARAQRLVEAEAQRLVEAEAQRLVEAEAQRLVEAEAQRLATEAEAQRLVEAEAQRLADFNIFFHDLTTNGNAAVTLRFQGNPNNHAFVTELFREHFDPHFELGANIPWWTERLEKIYIDNRAAVEAEIFNGERPFLLRLLNRLHLPAARENFEHLLQQIIVNGREAIARQLYNDNPVAADAVARPIVRM